MDTQIAYRPQSGDRLPFLRAQLDLCGAKCHRPNISVALKLEATPKIGRRAGGASSSSGGGKPKGKTKRSRRLNLTTSKEEEKEEEEEDGDSWAFLANKKVENSDAKFMSEASGERFHCDRETYSMVSKRRLCGKLSKLSVIYLKLRENILLSLYLKKAAHFYLNETRQDS